MPIHWKPLYFLGLLFLFSCGNSGDASSQNTDKTISDIKEKYKDVKPCEVFTIEAIKDYFSLNEDLEILVKDSNTPYPNCYTSWTLGTKKMMKMNNTEYETDVWNKINLVIVTDLDKSAFEAATSRYTDKETLSIGDMAVWSKRTSKITVMVDRTLFHLQIQAPDYPMDVKPMLIEVGEMVISNLK